MSTPGPWVYLDIGEIAAGEDLSVIVAVINEGDNSPPSIDTEANGQLLAAAPELLAALKGLLAWMPVTGNGAAAARDEISAARDAIAKAEGAA